MIYPSIGRRVWFWPNLEDPKNAIQVADFRQPCDAGVIFVVNDRCVHLSVTDHFGTTHAVKHVQLLQDNDVRPGRNAAFAEWMPYQAAQAKKEEQRTADSALREIKEAQLKQEAEFLAKVNQSTETLDEPKNSSPPSLPPPPSGTPS